MRLQVGPGKVQEVAVGVVACAQTCSGCLIKGRNGLVQHAK